jgi:transcription initiation factor TFIIA large subunit
MSNAHVGAVYDHIIQEVINAVRVDFEENGVDDGILEELKKGWQHKLSQLGVAQFPWDPKPEPVQPPAPAPPANTAPVNNTAAQQAQQQAQQQAAANYTQSTLSPQTSAQPISHISNPQQNGNGMIKNEPGLKNDPIIKQEPGTQAAPGLVYASNAAPRGQTVARQRAAQALESQYGNRAAASISALHSMQPQRPGQPPTPQQQQQMQQQMQQMRQQQMQQQQQQQQLNPQQYANAMQRQMQQQVQQQAQQQQAANGAPNGLPAAQVDGPSDGFEGVLMQRGPDGQPVEMGRVEIDNIIHAQMLARAKQMEGGGLMLPLREATRHRGVAKKRAAAAGPSQVDGPDDDFKDEDLDDDAINSDLDDPDDDKDDDEDDEDSMSHMMLCMYDKVQRVKNKWKCTLKDGVLTVNGREYVFHKATGEYEW